MLETLEFFLSSPSHLASFALGSVLTFSAKFGFACFDSARMRKLNKDLVAKFHTRLKACRAQYKQDTKELKLKHKNLIKIIRHKHKERLNIYENRLQELSAAWNAECQENQELIKRCDKLENKIKLLKAQLRI